MIEYLGLLYTIGKDIKAYLSWNEETKIVDFQWIEKSGFKAKAENEGFQLYWSSPEKVPTRLLNGYEIVYEIDKSNKVKHRLELKDGSVLIGKRKKNNLSVSNQSN